MKTIHVATIQIAIETNDQDEACDAISEALREKCLDWGYLLIGEQWCLPKVKLVPSDYQEGDFLK